MKLSRESAILISICLADLVTTIWLVYGHGAQEANPLMRGFLDHGVIVFTLAKACFCLVPLALIEWARRDHPHFVRCALRTGIALYLGFYGSVVWKINQGSSEPDLTVAQIASITEYANTPSTQQEMDVKRAQLASSAFGQ